MHRHFTTKLLKIQKHRCQKIQQRISPLISLLLEFLDISRTCMHDHNSYLDPIRHFTSAGIGFPAETWARVHLHARSVADILLAIMYATTPCRSRAKLTQWRSTTKVRSWTVLPRINKVLHTDSLVCRIDWCQTRNKTRHYCWNFWQKSLKNCVAVGDMSQWRVHLAQTKILNKKGQ